MKGNGAIFSTFSDGGRHRLRLWRDTDHLGAKGVVTFVMLNPSTADASTDDPTIQRCKCYAHDWGYAQLQVVNLFTFRATNPKELKHALDAGECLNIVGFASHIKKAMREADVVIAAWGALPAWARPRAAEVDVMLDPRRWFVLGVTKHGDPRHPLYMRKNIEPQPWNYTTKKIEPRFLPPE